ncbi:hypothetical protein B0H14DRAFT_2632654 [Mycena olivaceomarginata]|nr:hypothetical protein B0H14DRAFT_2632654 [Mycena olivaceomarginata]
MRGIGGPENTLSRETKNLPQDSRRANFLIIAIHCVHEQTKYNSGDLDHDIVEDKEAKSTAAKKPNPMLGVPGQNHRRKATGSTVGDKRKQSGHPELDMLELAGAIRGMALGGRTLVRCRWWHREGQKKGERGKDKRKSGYEITRVIPSRSLNRMISDVQRTTSTSGFHALDSAPGNTESNHPVRDQCNRAHQCRNAPDLEADNPGDELGLPVALGGAVDATSITNDCRT